MLLVIYHRGHVLREFLRHLLAYTLQAQLMNGPIQDLERDAYDSTSILRGYLAKNRLVVYQIDRHQPELPNEDIRVESVARHLRTAFGTPAFKLTLE